MNTYVLVCFLAYFIIFIFIYSYIFIILDIYMYIWLYYVFYCVCVIKIKFLNISLYILIFFGFGLVGWAGRWYQLKTILVFAIPQLLGDLMGRRARIQTLFSLTPWLRTACLIHGYTFKYIRGYFLNEYLFNFVYKVLIPARLLKVKWSHGQPWSNNNNCKIWEMNKRH